MNKTIFSAAAILLLTFIVPNVAFAADREDETPLKTERFKTKHGSAVRNEYRTFAHTCMDSNIDSRASARNGACFIEIKIAGEWKYLDHNASRDASMWRSLPNTLLNGTVPSIIQGEALKSAAGRSCSGGSCGTTVNNINSLTSNANLEVSLPCTGVCPPGG